MKNPQSFSLANPVVVLLTLILGFAACTQAPPIDEDQFVVEATIAGLQTAILNEQTTCREIVQAYLDRIEAYDQSTGLNAITEINPRALAKADSIDQAISAGEEQGSLFCAPILVKDNFDTHDMVTTGGSIALAGSIPPDDAFMVRRIREEGAIVIAKTNMAEWAFSPRQSVSSSYDTTANAYALDRTPAGSSGGTASGVAASFGVAGLGSDTGNSIRGPSSHLSLAGIRSTIGLTSRDGVVPLSFDRDIAGPMTRTVEDAARIFNVVAGYDPADFYTEAGRDRKEEDYTAFLDTNAVQGKRLGILTSHANPERADSAVYALFEEAAEELRSMGAEVVDFEIEGMRELMSAGNWCNRFRYDMHQYLLSLGEDAPMSDVLETLETGAYGADVERILNVIAEEEPEIIHPAERAEPCPDFADHAGRQALLAAVVGAMDEAGIDAFIFPSWSYPPAPLDNANEEYRGDNSQGLIPAAGLPAITVPMGFTNGNLPAGLQIAGRPFSEGLLFGLAYAYEQGTHHRRPPELFPPLAPDQ
ncbi:amidase [Rhodohalobacter mucosus]|uniref:Glutamyl-tRNA amidotransferase n=1 Tax=Rhodohalobacter mucosus TaxID=2079485 RepID=A0A316U1C9_9BACT|nr:amidase family protein [Rhodohalobacter mucosus]PWN06706.1 glutamyl-tRNA amidotransferase [Rhodohalobacter mucosus]